MENPYQLQIPKDGTSAMCKSRRMLESIISEHMEGFGEALEGRVAKDPAKRCKAHQLLRITHACAGQAISVAENMVQRANPLQSMNMNFSFEAALGASTTLTHVTDFVTQIIHMSLDVYPRLLAPNLVSVQPFTQPSGFVFFLKRKAGDAGAAGSPAGRNLSNLSQFDSDYGKLGSGTNASNATANEGTQLKTVRTELTKTLVETTYYGLMHQHSHQLDVALRSQYGLDIGQLGDVTTAEELAWEVDRKVISGLETFALTNPLGTVFFDDTAGGSYAGFTPSEQKAYDKKLFGETMTSVEIDMSAAIYRMPNWYLVGKNMAKVMARSPEFFAEKTGTEYFDQVMNRGSIIQSGRLRDGSVIWFDPQLDVNTMIAGYVDNMNPFYAGYIFSPFGAASLLTAAFTDPDNLLTKKARAVAFAQVGVRADQFRVIKLGIGS